MTNHYDYLERVLPGLFKSLGIQGENNGIIAAHGDKFYSYKVVFENAGLTFCQGAALMILTYVFPYSRESRQTTNGWVAPIDWVITNKDRFVHLLPKE